MNKKKPLVLCILDGWGSSPEVQGNAVRQAETPFLDRLFSQYKSTELMASGTDVGLIAGQMGDSNVGHLNIGAGRIVYQWLGLINKSIESGEFFSNQTLIDSINQAKSTGGNLHLMGLLSDGGVHSHLEHLEALVEKAESMDFNRVYIHAFLDGRDVPPKSAQLYLEQLEDFLKSKKCAKLATISGRFYAMDRDNRWERTEKFWQALVENKGIKKDKAIQALQASYDQGVNDEFVLPTVLPEAVPLKTGDSVFLFNFRADRLRQLASVLSEEDFNGFDRKIWPQVNLSAMTRIAEQFQFPVAFEPVDMEMTLGEVLSLAGKKQLRLAETEKYAHVTFFFNGGQENKFDLEERILVPSPKVLTYDLKPAMSAEKITDELCQAIEQREYDFILVNYANGDMVGHTGIWPAALAAMAALDQSIKRVHAALEKVGGTLILTADHGNIEQMLDQEEPHTAHTTNPVPFLLVADDLDIELEQEGRLADIAPTVLEIMGIEKPVQMTGQSLLIKK
ncbi:MAG: 2,3-bisphosphoglycerate-independent phosphoglycerate mutase [Firmicutes bacterium]|nr:2,3-bisphosphoglycerate-independent phosphoglycerate mutase [Bacillota bacterium]